MTESTFLTTERAAALLGVSATRIRFLIRQGRLPAVRLGRDWLIDPAALLEFERRPQGWPKGRPRRPAE